MEEARLLFHRPSDILSIADCMNGPLELDHAVLLVGWGARDHKTSKPFFVVKNR